MSCNLVWNHPCDFTIKPERSTSSIRSCDTKCNYPCQNKGTFSTKYYWSSTEIVYNLLKISQMASCLLFYFNLIGYFKRVLKSDWLFCFSMNFLNWNSFNAQVMARCHVISQTTQVCPLQWLWMIDDVGHMSDVKYYLCIIINCFNSFNIPQPHWFVIFHFLTTSYSMKHSRLFISYMKRRSQTCDYN